MLLLEKMTIAEVLKMQKSKMYKGESVYGSGYDSNATGRYQFMSYVLEEEIIKVKLWIAS